MDYATRCVMVAATPHHTAKDAQGSLLFVHGPMREIVLAGAPELKRKVVKALMKVLQAKQVPPVLISPRPTRIY